MNFVLNYYKEKIISFFNRKYICKKEGHIFSVKVFVVTMKEESTNEYYDFYVKGEICDRCGAIGEIFEKKTKAKSILRRKEKKKIEKDGYIIKLILRGEKI